MQTKPVRAIVCGTSFGRFYLRALAANPDIELVGILCRADLRLLRAMPASLTIACESGVLTLADTHGPAIWNPRLHTHRDVTHRLVLTGPGTERLAKQFNHPGQ
ncbi:hypothetical protein SSYM_0556 [Serratia symbiotica str. Tucson]|uniref:Thiazolinyl imide reductase n=2 Tax=Serratia symbiotica TaxID=138074 RepID=E9CK33_9GAMM|nr:hypothetical protein [Serratia symbiotica]EFW13099.1 hypothetical protein SSYM_0556 [Serratia symbiotica str. Tucson]BBI91807.1 uncharacterized protein SSYIS1_12020 [Serratia symbiotica]